MTSGAAIESRLRVDLGLLPGEVTSTYKVGLGSPRLGLDLFRLSLSLVSKSL